MVDRKEDEAVSERIAREIRAEKARAELEGDRKVGVRETATRLGNRLRRER